MGKMRIISWVVTVWAGIGIPVAGAEGVKLSFSAPQTAGHWEALSAGWNDWAGKYSPMKPGQGKWVVDPGWQLKITPEGQLHSDNGNDAILAFQADRRCAVRWQVSLANAGSPLFFSVALGDKVLRSEQIDSGRKDLWRGTVDMEKGQALYFRNGLKHFHSRAAEQNFKITPVLTEVAPVPDVTKMPLAKDWPRVNGQPVFPIGFLYYDTGDPILSEFVKLGYDATQRDMGWKDIEPQKGVYDDTLVRETLDGAQKNGLKVSLLFSWHYQPEWLPGEWQFRSSDGKGVGAGWLPADIWNPEVREHQRKVIETVCRVAAKHPATLGYCLANEPDMGNFTVGYSEYTRKAFVEWLRKKFPTVQAMNDRWKTNFEAFERVKLPVPDLKTVNRRQWLDWILFRNDSFAAYWKWMADTIHEYHPGAIITHKMMWKGLTSELAAPTQQNYRLWSQSVEVTGGDIYPHAYEDFIFRWLADGYRSFGQGKYAWLNEHNVSSIEKPGSTIPPVDTYRAWFWQGIGRGITGYFHWYLPPNLIGTDGGCYCYDDGTLSDSFWALTREVYRLRKIQPWIMRTHPAEPDVAILNSWPTVIQRPGVEPSQYATAVMDELYRCHVPFSLVDEQQLRRGDLGHIRALLLPGAFCLADEDIQAIRRLADKGVLIVAWPGTGDFNEFNEKAGGRMDRDFGNHITGYSTKTLFPTRKLIDRNFETWDFTKKAGNHRVITWAYGKTTVKIAGGKHLLSVMAGKKLEGGPLIGLEDIQKPFERNSKVTTTQATIMATFPDKTPAMTQYGRYVYVASSPMATGLGWYQALREMLVCHGVQPPGYVRDNKDNPIGHIDYAVLEGAGFRLVIVTNFVLSNLYDGIPVSGVRIGFRGGRTMRVFQMLDRMRELTPIRKGVYGELEAAFLPGEAKVFLVIP